MRITNSTLRKIIREELEAAMNEADDGFQIGSIKGAFSKEFGSRLQQMLAIKADLKKDLKRDPTPEELRKAMRAAGMRDPGEEAPMSEAVEHDMLFDLVVNAGIVMGKVDRNKFFNFLRARDLTTLDAIKDNRGPITAWLKDNR
jgi:hypothetical protein